MFLSVIVLVAVACGLREHWGRLAGEQRASDRILGRWFAQGVMVPSFVWASINLGLATRLPPLIPEIALAQGAGETWWHLWIRAAIQGAALITVSWSAVTYTVMAMVIARRAGNSREFKASAFLVGVPMFLLAALMLHRESWAHLPAAVVIFLFPLVHTTLGQVEKPAPVPIYGAARGKMNFGKYEDAELEVIHQLEKKENDFQGWMMLAELYATKYRRLDDAAQVIVDLCNDPTIQQVEVSVACHKLADWQLELGQNPRAAVAALELLIQRAPETHFAMMAKQRIRQIPRTREDLLEQKTPRAIRLPSLREKFEDSGPAPVQDGDATAEANRLSDRLRDNPNDFPTRERLAIVLAEKLGHVQLGVEQLRLMVKMPDASREEAAKWIAQIASWERRLNKDEGKFREALAEILRDFPNTTQALSARRQLQLIENEAVDRATPSEKPATPSIRLTVPKS